MADDVGARHVPDAAFDGGRRRSLPPRPRSRRMISLTPLVDIVFLLLTFFMLSSTLSPFGLLLFSGTPRAGAAAAAAVPVAAAAPELVLSVGAGRLRLAGIEIGPGELGAALVLERRGGARRLTILASRDASVQDLVGALDAAGHADFATVSLVDLR